MKTRDLFFGLVALLLGVGTSFASLVKPLSIDAYAETKLTNDPQEQWQCRKIGQCDNVEGATCHILVPLTTGGSKNVIARPMNTCPAGTLPQSIEEAVPGDFEFYDVQ